MIPELISYIKREREQFDAASLVLRFLVIPYTLGLDWLIFRGSDVIFWERAGFVTFVTLYTTLRFGMYVFYKESKRDIPGDFMPITITFDLIGLAWASMTYGFSIVVLLGFCLIAIYSSFLFPRRTYHFIVSLVFISYFYSTILPMALRPDRILVQGNYSLTIYLYVLSGPLFAAGILYLLGLIKKSVSVRDKAIDEQQEIKSDFIATSAHQLRTPLSGIKWSIQSFMEGDLGKVTKEQESYLQKMYAASNTLIEQVNTLMQIIRIEEGDLHYTFQKVAVNDVIEEALDEFEMQLKEKNLKLELDLCPDEVELSLDKVQFGFVIQNLVSNAIKYTPPHKKIWVTCEQKKGAVLITVRDQGIGIPESDQQQIFHKFFRATNAKLTSTGSSGVGLYVAKQIVLAHQGQIWFETEQDKGSTFFVSLPM